MFTGASMNRVGNVLIQHFSASEFHFPDQMDGEFLMYLDAVRERAGLPFHLTSDGRSPQHNAEVGGVATSLHIFDPSNQAVKARAVDFSISEFDKHLVPWTTFAQITQAVIDIWREHKYSFGFELELQYGQHNKHVHLGLFRVPGHPCHLVVKADADVTP